MRCLALLKHFIENHKVLVGMIFFPLIFSSCTKSEKVEFTLSHVNPGTSFSLPPIERCDSFSVVPPFFDMDRLNNVEMLHDIRDVCEEMLIRDEVTTLLFYHKSRVVAYTVMQRSIADFASFDASKKYSIGQQLFLNKERKVIINH